MARPLIAVVDTGYESYAVERSLFEGAGYDLRIFDGNPLDAGARRRFAGDAVGILVRGTVVDGAFMDGVPGLKAIVRYGVGYDNIDLAAASRRGVRVSNVQGYASHAVSDHALALMFACARALPLGRERLRSHFARPPRRPIREFRELTLGIVGLGRIGGVLCRKASGLFRAIVASDPYVPDGRFAELGAARGDLGALLEQSDVVSLHCNLTAETTRLIDRSAVRRMRRAPILVNTARGPVADERALVEALDEGWIHSAGIDVYPAEPPGPECEALLRHPHVIATGHYAWYSEAASAELQRRAAENLLGLLRGEPVADALNAGKGSGNA